MVNSRKSMKRRLDICVALIVVLSGCQFSSDIETRTRPEQDPLIGKSFELKLDAQVVLNKYPKWFALAPAGAPPMYTTTTRQAPAGTRFEVFQTQRRRIQQGLFNYPAHFAFAHMRFADGELLTVEVRSYRILITSEDGTWGPEGGEGKYIRPVAHR
jgi:hypothetical protein